jgi:hypothetical protein
VAEADQSRWKRGLYVTPLSRRLFLFGRRGMMTRWRGRRVDLELTRGEACAWIEEHLGKVENYLKDA